MGAMAFQITSLTIVYSTVYSVADQRKHQSSASLAFVRGIHRWLVNSSHAQRARYAENVSIWKRHLDGVLMFRGFQVLLTVELVSDSRQPYSAPGQFPDQYRLETSIVHPGNDSSRFVWSVYIIIDPLCLFDWLGSRSVSRDGRYHT